MAEKALNQGLVQVYTGNGKGKTTAALGLAARAQGQGLKVHIIFFMKGGYPYGERVSLDQMPNISYQVFGHERFVDPQNILQEDKEQAELAMKSAREAIKSGKYDMVILDEINVASAWKLIDVEDVLKMIKGKPDSVELVLTGRYADPRVIDKAELVTEIAEIKHPYKQGIPARRGIEY